MDRKDIIILIALGIFAGFSIYKKYFRKGADSQVKSEDGREDKGNSTYDNDYEPYSGDED